MPGTKILSAILIMIPAAVLLTAQQSFSEPAAEACKLSPSGSTPRGSHWYYRVNHAKQHCWYLGAAGAHLNSRAVTAATSESAPATKTESPADGESSAPPQAWPAAAAPAEAAQPAPREAASAQATPAQAALAQTASANQAAGPGFVARWPENLPKAEDMEASEPAPVSSSYAERHDAVDTTAQMPSKWPLAETDRATAATAGEKALRYFSIAGILAIPLLLVAGWVAKFAREPHRSNFRDVLRTMATRLRLRRRAAFDEFFVARSAAAARRISPDWRARTPTDPAHDLKTSLAELMRDLRRAAEPSEPVWHAERWPDRASDGDLRPFLQAAE